MYQKLQLMLSHPVSGLNGLICPKYSQANIRAISQHTFCKEATLLIQRGIRLNPNLPVPTGCLKR